MAEERENQISQQEGQNDEADFLGHAQEGLLDDTDPDEAKLKLANDEDDDVEGHVHHPQQEP
jgi:hypothetical protein